MIQETLEEWYPNKEVFEVDSDCKIIVKMTKQGMISDIDFIIDNFFPLEGKYVEIMWGNHYGIDFLAYKIYDI